MTGFEKSKLFFAAAAVALVIQGCGQQKVKQGTGTIDPPRGVTPHGSTDIFTLRHKIEIQQYTVDIDNAHPNHVDLFNRIRIFFGNVVPGLPTSVEAHTTGFKWIQNSSTGQLRFETTTDQGSLHSDFVSIPNSSLFPAPSSTSGPVDVVMTAPLNNWVHSYSAPYNMIRIKGTMVAGKVSGFVCVRTVATHDDWSQGYFNQPITHIGLLFWRVTEVAPWGTLKSNTDTEITSLRNLFQDTCPSFRNYGDNPTHFVQRKVGDFIDIPKEDILP